QKQKPIVAFLGPNATYTHQASLNLFPTETHTLTPVPTIEDVFTSIQSNTATYGVVPFENSSNGSVVFTLDLFADRDSKHPDILVCGETYVRVQHCLVGHARSNPPSQPPSQAPSQHPNPGTTDELPDLTHLTKLYSHPQAWGQCTRFLSSHLRGLERQDVSSTSKAAELVARDPSRTSAAISSALSAQQHGLQVLVRGIEDRSDNTTRFLVIRRKDTAPKHVGGSNTIHDDSGELTPKDAAEYHKDYKTLISFTLPHSDPGALAECLLVFKRRGLSLTSINTRPSG
ncbi:PDT-domain-containing protein, partial [Sporormia fimetaria CBS 119925]